MSETTGGVRPKRFWLDVSVRTIKGLGHTATLALLALPLVSLSNCGGPVISYTGYQALAGVQFPAAQFDVTPGEYPDFSPDLWVAIIILVALAAIGTTWRGGVKGAMAGIGLAILGFVALAQAIAFFTEPRGLEAWSAEGAIGSVWIGLVYVGSAVLDLGWLTAKGWFEYRRRRAGGADRGDWLALAIGSTFFLSLLGLAVASITILLVALAHS